MQNSVSTIAVNSNESVYNDLPDVIDVSRLLAAFQAHLNKTGKVCPRPWYWRRFSNLFYTGYEPPWLSSWWETSITDKKTLFIRQLECLALHTSQFTEAYRFLQNLEDKHWYYGR